jgi:hypothetical protein
MGATVPILLIALAFLALLLLRVVILLIMRSGETHRTPNRNTPPPTVITFDKPQGQHHDHP